MTGAELLLRSDTGPPNHQWFGTVLAMAPLEERLQWLEDVGTRAGFVVADGELALERIGVVAGDFVVQSQSSQTDL